MTCLPDPNLTARCTFGYAWQLSMHVHRDGWHPGTGLLLDHLVGRIVTWHATGLGAVWS